MGMLFKVLLGMSPVVAILLYVVLGQQENREAKIDVRQVEMKIDTERFNESFEQSEIEFADTNKSKIYHTKKRDEHIENVDVILENRIKAKERAKKLQQKSEVNFAEMEKTLDNFDDKDFDF